MVFECETRPRCFILLYSGWLRNEKYKWKVNWVFTFSHKIWLKLVSGQNISNYIFHNDFWTIPIGLYIKAAVFFVSTFNVATKWTSKRIPQQVIYSLGRWILEIASRSMLRCWPNKIAKPNESVGEVSWPMKRFPGQNRRWKEERRFVEKFRLTGDSLDCQLTSPLLCSSRNTSMKFASNEQHSY